MSICTKLSNGWYAGCGFLKIDEIPSSSEGDASDTASASLSVSLLRDIHALGFQDVSTFELVFISPEEPGGSLVSLIISRVIAQSMDKAESAVEATNSYLMKRLTSLGYKCHALVDDESFKLLRRFPFSSVTAVMKGEVVDPSAQAPIPYYRSGLLASQQSQCEKLLSDMQSSSGVAVSFVVMPTAMTDDERSFSIAMRDSLTQITNGVRMGTEFFRDVAAGNSLSYFDELIHSNSELFMAYSLVMSASNDAGIIVSDVRSLFGGQDGCEAVWKRLPEGLVSPDSLCFHPWNVADFMMNLGHDASLLREMIGSNALLRTPLFSWKEEGRSTFPLPEGFDVAGYFGKAAFRQSNEALDPAMTAEDVVRLGVLDDSGVSMGFPIADFMRHCVLVGVPGSGKTTMALSLLLRLNERKIPFLAIEPSKEEYRALLDAIPNLAVYSPGNLNLCQLPLNPFLPPEGVTVDKYIPVVFSAFQAAFSMESPLDSILMQAIRKAYLEYGWRGDSTIDDKRARIFGLSEFVIVFKHLIASSSYGNEVRGNIESGGTFRLLSLIQQNHLVFDTDASVSISELLAGPVVLELNAIGSTEQKALVMALLLGKISAYVKSNYVSGHELRNVLMIDEAHVLLDSGGETGASERLIQDMVAEMRAYGLGLVIADQTPSRIGRNIIANTDLKIALRLVQREERELIGASCNMNDRYMEEMASFQVGEAFVYSRRLKVPKKIVADNTFDMYGIGSSCSDVKLRNHLRGRFGDIGERCPFFNCRFCPHCEQGCSGQVRSEAEYLSERIYGVFGGKVRDKNTLMKYVVALPKAIVHYSVGPVGPRLRFCTQLHFFRRACLDKAFLFDEQQSNQLFSRVAADSESAVIEEGESGES